MTHITRKLVASALGLLAGLLLPAMGGAQTGATTWRSYGPFTGFISSVPRHSAPLGSIVDGDSSMNWLVDPTERKLVRRKGVSPYDSLLIEQPGWKPWVRHIRALDVAQLTYPTVGALLTNEASNTGTVVVRDLANGSNYQLGTEHRNCYSTTGVDDVTYFYTPTWRWSTNSIIRGVDSTQRSQTVIKARKMHDSGNWLFIPGGDNTPLMWNKRFNRSSGGCTQEFRLRPWGHYPPMYCPNVPTSEMPTRSSTAKPWGEGDKFYVSVVFQFEDGSYSPPAIPFLATTSPSGTGGATGFVRLTDNGDLTAEFFDYIPWRNIPIGPNGTVSRILLRTPKFSKSIGAVPGFSDLRVTAIIPNNTQTSYNDPNGDDGSLVTNSEVVRFDHTWPKSTRYVFSNDARTVICGAAKPNPAAIILCPTGKTATRDINGNSSGVGYTDIDDLVPGVLTSGEAFGVKVTSDSLNLYYKTSTQFFMTAFVLSSYSSIQALVDGINSTTTGSNCKEWAAQLAPGADGYAAPTKLLNTASSNTNDASRFGSVSAIQWVRGPSWPGVLYYSYVWQSSYPTDHQSIYFTGASPGHAQNAPLNFYVGNRRSPPSRLVGRCLGGAAVRDRFVICYERAIYVLRNMRGGGTGVDDDYRLLPLNESRGCVSWASIATGDGWVGYMTPDGYVITDTDREVLISRDVWHRQKNTGEWANEMTKAIAATAADADTAATFHAQVLGSSIHITYRKSASATTADRRLVYDYSSNSAASGIDEVLNNGVPFGWSTPLTNNFSAMCEAQIDASGPYRFGGMDKSASSRGRYDIIDTGTKDGTTTFGATAFFPTDFAETYNLKAAEQALMIYRKNATGLTLTLYREQARTVGYSNSLSASGSGGFARQVLDLETAARGPCATFELKLTDNGGDGTAILPEIWTIALRYRTLESVR